MYAHSLKFKRYYMIYSEKFFSHGLPDSQLPSSEAITIISVSLYLSRNNNHTHTYIHTSSGT